MTGPAVFAKQEITVSAKKNGSGAQIDTINLTDEDRQTKSLPDILSGRVGVQVKRNGSDGGYSSVYVRGTNANQLLVCIDGIPLNDSVYGETNFENIPVSCIERIEVYRGFTPVIFPRSGIGGIINLVTKKGRGATETGISAGAGSFRTGKVSVFHSFNRENDQVLVTGNASAGKGDFSFTNDNGTSFNHDDDFTDRRKNNAFKSGGFTARYAHNADTFSIDALSDTFIKAQEIASYNNKASHARLDTARSVNSVKAGFDRIGGIPLSADLTAFASARRDRYDDRRNEIGFFSEKTKGTLFSLGSQAYAEYRTEMLDQIIALSVDAQHDTYYMTREQNGDSTGYPSQRRFTSHAGVEDSIRLFDRRIAITPQIRAEANRDHASERKGDSSARYSADPGVCLFIQPVKDLIYLRGTWEKKHRTPSFAELFGNRGTIKGNPDLKDEKSEGYDLSAGLEYNDYSSEYMQSFGVEYTFFRTRVEDIIVFYQNSQYTLVADNISAAQITGHEISAHSTVFDHAELSFNQTIQFAEDDSDIPYYRGKYLPFRPIFETCASLRIFNSSGSITYELSRTGSNFRDRANSDALYVRSRVYHSVSAQFSPASGLTIMVAVKNITDNRTMDVAGYPLPGRTFSGSVQYIF